MNPFEYTDGVPALTAERITFTPDEPERGSFTLKTAGFTIRGIDAVPGEYPLSMGISKRRRVHSSADGTESSLDTEDAIPFGEEPSVVRKYEFTDNTMSVRTDFILRHSFPMKSIIGGGLRMEGVKTLRIREQAASSVPEAIDFTVQEDGAELYKSKIIPLEISFIDRDGAEVVFESGASLWRWNLPDRLPGRALFTIRKEGEALMFYWNLYEFQGSTAEEQPPHGRNLRIVWNLRFGKDLPSDGAFRKTFDAVKYDWPESCRVRTADGGTLPVPCFRASGTQAVLKRFVRSLLADAKPGEVYAVRIPEETICFSAAHEDRAGKEVLAHWDRASKDEFVRWANRQLSSSGASLRLIR